MKRARNTNNVKRQFLIAVLFIALLVSAVPVSAGITDVLDSAWSRARPYLQTVRDAGQSAFAAASDFAGQVSDTIDGQPWLYWVAPLPTLATRVAAEGVDVLDRGVQAGAAYGRGDMSGTSAISHVLFGDAREYRAEQAAEEEEEEEAGERTPAAAPTTPGAGGGAAPAGAAAPAAGTPAAGTPATGTPATGTPAEGTAGGGSGARTNAGPSVPITIPSGQRYCASIAGTTVYFVTMGSSGDTLSFTNLRRESVATDASLADARGMRLMFNTAVTQRYGVTVAGLTGTGTAQMHDVRIYAEEGRVTFYLGADNSAPVDFTLNLTNSGFRATQTSEIRVGGRAGAMPVCPAGTAGLEAGGPCGSIQGQIVTIRIPGIMDSSMFSLENLESTATPAGARVPVSQCAGIQAAERAAAAPTGPTVCSLTHVAGGSQENCPTGETLFMAGTMRAGTCSGNQATACRNSTGTVQWRNGDRLMNGIVQVESCPTGGCTEQQITDRLCFCLLDGIKQVTSAGSMFECPTG